MTLTLSNSFLATEIKNILDSQTITYSRVIGNGTIIQFTNDDGSKIILDVLIMSISKADLSHNQNRISISLSSDTLSPKVVFKIAQNLDDLYGKYIEIDI